MSDDVHLLAAALRAASALAANDRAALVPLPLRNRHLQPAGYPARSDAR